MLVKMNLIFMIDYMSYQISMRFNKRIYVLFYDFIKYYQIPSKFGRLLCFMRLQIKFS
jgi:hypothetical protein